MIMGERIGQDTEMSRRGFLGTAMAGLGAFALGGLVGCTSDSSAGASDASSASTAPSTWDETFDVVVCGAGGSGLSAAFSALENGAAGVLVCEKGTYCGGTTALSEGAIQASGTTWQKQLGKVGVENDSVENHFNYWMCEGEGLVDESLVRTMAENAADNLQWMADNFGVTFSKVFGAYPVPYLPSEYVSDRIHLITDATDETKTGGVVWTTGAQKAVEAAGGEIRTETEVTQLYVDGDNGVVGVCAGGKNIKATKGVVLAMAGIEHNEELAFKFNPQQYWDIKTQNLLTSTNDTGDGIRMGMEIGADVACFHGCVDLLLETWSYTNNSQPQVDYVLVNTQGLRFVREDTTYAYHCRSLFNESMKWGGADGCTWMVADNKMTTSDHTACTWSDKATKCTRDADIASGKLLTADTIEGLAAAMGVPAANLTATIEKWNAAAAAGTDAEFGRTVQLNPLDQAPYFAWKTINSNIGAIGGLKIDTTAAILDRSGNPIPHLFGAGADTGGWIGPYYPGSGTCLQGALNWGRIAGRSAANA